VRDDVTYIFPVEEILEQNFSHVAVLTPGFGTCVQYYEVVSADEGKLHASLGFLGTDSAFGHLEITQTEQGLYRLGGEYLVGVKNDDFGYDRYDHTNVIDLAKFTGWDPLTFRQGKDFQAPWEVDFNNVRKGEANQGVLDLADGHFAPLTGIQCPVILSSLIDNNLNPLLDDSGVVKNFGAFSKGFNDPNMRGCASLLALPGSQYNGLLMSLLGESSSFGSPSLPDVDVDDLRNVTTTIAQMASFYVFTGNAPTKDVHGIKQWTSYVFMFLQVDYQNDIWAVVNLVDPTLVFNQTQVDMFTNATFNQTLGINKFNLGRTADLAILYQAFDSSLGLGDFDIDYELDLTVNFYQRVQHLDSDLKLQKLKNSENQDTTDTYVKEAKKAKKGRSYKNRNKKQNRRRRRRQRKAAKAAKKLDYKN
jgi:hypothetical protein